MRHDDNSDPYLTNEYIDELIQNARQHEEMRQSLTKEPGLRLAYDIRRAYQGEVDQDRHSLESVFLRLMGDQVTAQSGEIPLPGRNVPQDMPTNASDWEWEIEISTLHSYGAKQSGKNSRHSFRHLFGMGVAAAAILALVLSWSLIFSGRPQVPSTAIAVKPPVTATPTSPYPSFPLLAFRDSLTTGPMTIWPSSPGCRFSPTGLQVDIALAGHEQDCLRESVAFLEMAYQATMTITQGDCGGLIFRALDFDMKNLGFFYVCTDGTYNVGYVVDSKDGKGQNFFPKAQSNPVVHKGLNQPNVLAVTIRGDEVDVYINGLMVTRVHQAIFTTRLAVGYVGLVALDFHHATSITFTNAMGWIAETPPGSH